MNTTVFALCFSKLTLAIFGKTGNVRWSQEMMEAFHHQLKSLFILNGFYLCHVHQISFSHIQMYYVFVLAPVIRNVMEFKVLTLTPHILPRPKKHSRSSEDRCGVASWHVHYVYSLYITCV